MAKFIKIDSMDEGVISFYVSLDGEPEEQVTPIVNTDGTKSLEYEVTNVSQGDHTVLIAADNGWEKVYDDPFIFSRPMPLTKPFGIYLSNG